MANQLQSDRTAETNSNQKMMITLTRSANQVFDYITSFFAEFKLVSKMTILRLLKITPSHKRGDNHYTWHIGNRVGNGEYVCQYTVDRLHLHLCRKLLTFTQSCTKSGRLRQKIINSESFFLALSRGKRLF